MNYKEKLRKLKKRRNGLKYNTEPFFSSPGTGTYGGYDMGNYGNIGTLENMDKFPLSLSDAAKNPGELWQTSGGKWAAKSHDGNIGYFDDREQAHQYATGQINTAPADPENFNRNRDLTGIDGEDDFTLDNDEGMCKLCHGGAMQGMDICVNCASDRMYQSGLDSDEEVCSYCRSRPAEDGKNFCSSCASDYYDNSYDDREESIKLREFLPRSPTERVKKDVWQNRDGKWAGRNKGSGEVRYFDDRVDAYKFYTGSSGTDTDIGSATTTEEDTHKFNRRHVDIGPPDDEPERRVSTSNESIQEILDLFERNYKREYEMYHSRPEQKKRRAQRNKTRRHFERAGKVKKGDGNDIHHRDGDTSNLSASNAVVMNKSKNRSMKPEHLKKESVMADPTPIDEKLRSLLKTKIKIVLLQHLKTKRL